MSWSPQQEAALRDVADWLKNPSEQVYRLFGYAGTGKTTLAKELAANMQRVIYGAYTGKAAYVLRQKGCADASTIHSLIYHPRDKSQETLKEYEAEFQMLSITVEANDPRLKELEKKKIAIERENMKRPSFTLNQESCVKDAGLVIIDECSMVDAQMGEDLMSFGRPILVLGDPAQLPPVGSPGFFTSQQPHTMLTEIHRQAAENPIIRMATLVREGKPLPLGDYGSSKVVTDMSREDLAQEALAADQILVGKNATRFTTNRRMRELLGKTGVVAIGDKLVCLRNDNEVGLLNGSIWEVEDYCALGENQCAMTVKDADRMLDVCAHTHYFEGKGSELQFWEKRDAQEFDFGYALTVHKAQGSQWNNVLLFDESASFRQDRAKWLYTGITRAAEKVTIKRD